MTEFDLIKHYFATQLEHRKDVKLGIGDDAAIISIPQGQELVVSTDTLVNGVHFPDNTPAYDVGYKALAVNLSDLAAMGASPAWTTLSVTIPNEDNKWIQEFCAGFFTLANRFQVQLIGGDISRGPLSITVQALGLLPQNKGLLRSSAMPGDYIYVTGTLGDAGAGLEVLENKIELREDYRHQVLQRFHQPEPRVATGSALLGIAHAAIDISDGLASDLKHILTASQVGAKLYVDKIPVSDALSHSLSQNHTLRLALSAGDDYELCFTIPPDNQKKLESKLATIPCRYTHIGEIIKQPGLNLLFQNGKKYVGKTEGYKHFK